MRASRREEGLARGAETYSPDDHAELDQSRWNCVEAWADGRHPLIGFAGCAPALVASAPAGVAGSAAGSLRTREQPGRIARFAGAAFHSCNAIRHSSGRVPPPA